MTPTAGSSSCCIFFLTFPIPSKTPCPQGVGCKKQNMSKTEAQPVPAMVVVEAVASVVVSGVAADVVVDDKRTKAKS